MKPPKCCHPDCENCPYVDCKFDGYSRYDDIVTDAIEKELQIESMDYDKRHSKEIQDRYNHSERGSRPQERIEILSTMQRVKRDTEVRKRQKEKRVNAVKEHMKRSQKK